MKRIALDAVIFLTAFFTPALGFMAAVGIVILADTCFGWWKAKKLDETRNSKKLRLGLTSKMLVYQTTLLTAFLLDYNLCDPIAFHFFPVHFALTRIVACFLIFLELQSIDEKLKLATGRGLFNRFAEFSRYAKAIVRKGKEMN